MRSVEEWIGKNDDEPVPTRVRLRRWRAAEGCCERCGHRFLPREEWDVDHCKPICLAGENRESNLRIVCIPCHSDKTRREIRVKAKSDRILARHIGIRKPRKILAWRNFKGEIVRAGRER